jgi:RNase P/RNase MRP subunit POP5
MPKKRPGEKYRYVAFRVDSDVPLARNDFLSALLSKSRGTSLGDRFRITVFEPEVGILKVPHTLRDDAVEVLSSVDSVRGRPCRVSTLKTSGTIKTLKDKYLPGKGSGMRD